jgi:starch synthase (maltosyl-transferring)
MESQEEGRRRIVIENVTPAIDCGRFAAKAIVGDDVEVEADALVDGHDQIACMLLHRSESQRKWRETPMAPIGNDRWRGTFPVPSMGSYRFTVEAWVDRFGTWRRDMAKWLAVDDEAMAVHLEFGAGLIEETAARANARDARRLEEWAHALRVLAGRNADSLAFEGAAAGNPAEAEIDALDPGLAELMARWSERRLVTRHDVELSVFADRSRARFSAWYEFFPRSAGEGRHGTFADARKMLPYIRDMGFDVVYLPPIHPVGRTHRKGRNNALEAGADDPGSPWAIGATQGGHKAIDPRLGTIDDFLRFRAAAEAHGLEVALDMAFQCSPDHPYVRQHPEWFRRLPDGSIQHAENPPKKYEDIVPFDFETDDWPGLWRELLSVFEFWIGHGVKIFRVDNPHTKPFPFWEWVIGEIRSKWPDVLFLSEAFTRPTVMYRLAKLGFSQSYTYFAWRNTKWEIEHYLRELTRPPVRDFFRPNFWPNTPDILTEYLQTGGRPAFTARLVLAATLSSNYGIYGPAFELLEHQPRSPGSEEYLDSEKYQLKDWDLGRGDSLREVIARVNRIRAENPALHRTENLRFHGVDAEALIAYSKRSPDGANTILVVVNLDPHHRQAGWTDLDLAALDIGDHDSYQVHDLLGGGRYLWSGRRNYVELNPQVVPAHIFRVAHRARTERDFDYFV